eukprot:UN34098
MVAPERRAGDVKHRTGPLRHCIFQGCKRALVSVMGSGIFSLKLYNLCSRASCPLVGRAHWVTFGAPRSSYGAGGSEGPGRQVARCGMLILFFQRYWCVSG